MKVVFLADARSPIAIHWVRWFVERKHAVHWISSRPAEPPLAGLASFRVLSIFPELPSGIKVRRGNRLLHPAATFIRHWFTPWRLDSQAKILLRHMEEIQPDLLHAMRIPQEGMVAAKASRLGRSTRKVPLLVSVWGDDFTYHARSSPIMAKLTRETMECANALHSDCLRDIQLAFKWGLRIDTKIIIEPTGGGINIASFSKKNRNTALIKEYSLPTDGFFILNPRGIRNVARTDTFFKTISSVRKAIPKAHFLALKMAGSSEAEGWIRKLEIQSCVTLLPPFPTARMGELFRLAPVMLSLTMHDGIPNVLLEAMACGSFPICGDLDSIREWIRDGENGFLVSPADPQEVAAAVIRAASDPVLRRNAAERNRRIIKERAEWRSVMGRVETFYHELI